MTKLDEKNVDELLELFDKNTSKYRFNRTEPLKKAFKLCEESKDERLEDIRKDIILFDLVAQPFPNKRFNPMIISKTEDGQEILYPDTKRDFSEEEISYYKNRFDSTSNVLLKAIYSDFIWFYKKDFVYSKKAIDCYIKSCDVYFKNEWDTELADSLMRALDIALSISNEELIERAFSKCNEHISLLVKSKRPSVTSHFNCRIKPFQFNSCIRCCKLPIDLAVSPIPICFPSSDFVN